MENTGQVQTVTISGVSEEDVQEILIQKRAAKVVTDAVRGLAAGWSSLRPLVIDIYGSGSMSLTLSPGDFDGRDMRKDESAAMRICRALIGGPVEFERVFNDLTGTFNWYGTGTNYTLSPATLHFMINASPGKCTVVKKTRQQVYYVSDCENEDEQA